MFKKATSCFIPEISSQIDFSRDGEASKKSITATNHAIPIPRDVMGRRLNKAYNHKPTCFLSRTADRPSCVSGLARCVRRPRSPYDPGHRLDLSPSYHRRHRRLRRRRRSGADAGGCPSISVALWRASASWLSRSPPAGYGARLLSRPPRLDLPKQIAFVSICTH